MNYYIKIKLFNAECWISLESKQINNYRQLVFGVGQSNGEQVSSDFVVGKLIKDLILYFKHDCFAAPELIEILPAAQTKDLPMYMQEARFSVLFYDAVFKV